MAAAVTGSSVAPSGCSGWAVDHLTWAVAWPCSAVLCCWRLPSLRPAAAPRPLRRSCTVGLAAWVARVHTGSWPPLPRGLPASVPISVSGVEGWALALEPGGNPQSPGSWLQVHPGVTAVALAWGRGQGSARSIHPPAAGVRAVPLLGSESSLPALSPSACGDWEDSWLACLAACLRHCVTFSVSRWMAASARLPAPPSGDSELPRRPAGTCSTDRGGSWQERQAL